MAATAASYQPQSHFSPPSQPSTPRLMHIASPTDPSQPRSSEQAGAEERSLDSTALTTPTRGDFGGIPGQRPLPTAPFSPAKIVSTPEADRSDSDNLNSTSKNQKEKKKKKKKKKRDASEDVEMADDDDDDGDSDNDSDASESKSRKKRKGQRFFCTEYPPCNLSFTRSEHLARHIRKHTGERPFQCHCSRRFSRLDNLRQHAQTVHVNEEIPGDSLAATGTRFQRQIRTDRVRAPANRARAGTGGSVGSHARGHSRNLSTASVASIVTNASTVPDDARRRPPPLAMASHTSACGRVPVDTYTSAPQPATQHASLTAPSPSGYSTPTSATFSTGATSPRFPAQSPSAAPRTAYYSPSAGHAARRLSVPSVPSPSQPYPPGHFTHPYHSPRPSAGPFHQHNASMNSINSINSPTSSMYSHSRHESEADLEWRRRTWHPGTYNAHVARPATSGLMYQQTPDDARPTTAGQSAASQYTRLPGIESFDKGGPAQITGRPTSPMQIDQSGRPPVYHGPMDAPGPDHSRSKSLWESSLHQNLNRLDITNTTPPRPAPAAPRARAPLPSFHFPQAPPGPSIAAASTTIGRGNEDRLGVSGNRHGWYGGSASRTQPISITQRRSPEESGSSDGIPTPSTSHGAEAHPAIVRSSGYIDARPSATYAGLDLSRAMDVDRHKPDPTRTDSGSHVYAHHSSGSQSYALQSEHDRHPPQPYAPQARSPGDMGRLEALVAVAASRTNEN